MFDLDRFAEILSTMRRNAMRTTLTAIGVFWGVFLLVLMVGFGNGLEQGTQRNMSGMATNSLFIWGDRTSVPYRGQVPGRYVRLTLDDALAIGKLEGVSVVAPRVSLGGRRASNAVTRGGKSGSFQVMGDMPDYVRVRPMTLKGRFINKLDIRKRRKVAVIGARVAEVLFSKGQDPIGETIQIKGTDFLVVGVFKSDRSGERAARQEATVHTPLTTFQKALTKWPYINYIAVLGKPDVRAGSIEPKLVEVLRKRHRVAPDDKQAIGSFNVDKEVQKVNNVFLAISLLIYLVAGATLIAGLVGVSNITMVSVRERTREIGIRKSIGATPSAVVGQIVLEAVVLACVAGYLGLVCGVGLLELIGLLMGSGQSADSSSAFAPPVVTLTTAIVATVAVAFGGAIAGFFPALHAARIRTVAALRDE